MRAQLAGNSGITRYLQLYTLLAQQLADGRIVAGSALPSEPELVRKYQVSRTTVRRALDRLEKESRIVRRRGSGTYARVRRSRTPFRMSTKTLLADLHMLAERTRARLLKFERVSTPEFVMRISEDFGSTSLLVHQSREIDGEPLLLSTSYIPASVANRLRKRDLGQKPVLVVLQELGVRPAHCERLMTAISADAAQAKSLKVPVGTPLMQARQTVRDTRGRTIQFSEVCYRPERLEFQADVALR